MKTYNIALLGAGNISRIMTNALANVPEANAYAVASRDLAKAQAFAVENGVEKAYGSYEAMLEDPAVDLVYIATPHSHHAGHAKLCIAHGKPVLCEKSFTGNAAQAREVLNLAREKGVFITEAIWTRYMPLAQKLRELVEREVVGEIHLMTANLSYPIGGIPRMAQPELAGGALLDLGVYPINIAAIAFGSGVESFTCSGQLTELGVDAQESITLHYPGNRLAVLYTSMLSLGDRYARIFGNRGHIEVDRTSEIRSIAVYDMQGNQTEFYEREEGLTGYEYEVRACLRALEAGEIECPEMPHAETLRIMQLMDGVRAQLGVVYPFD